MRDTGKRPTCKVLARRKGYVLYKNGELWATDERGWVTGTAILYLAECRLEVENDEIINGFEVMDRAIEEHEASLLNNI